MVPLSFPFDFLANGLLSGLVAAEEVDSKLAAEKMEDVDEIDVRVEDGERDKENGVDGFGGTPRLDDFIGATGSLPAFFPESSWTLSLYLAFVNLSNHLVATSLC
jgi:hypothetical protein